MTKNFRSLYNSVLKEMNQVPAQPVQPNAQQNNQQPQKVQIDPKQLADSITKIEDPELLAAIQKLLATKPTTPAAQPQAAQTPAPNAAQQPKTA